MSVKKWAMSDEWWVMSDGNWVTEIEWWKMLNQTSPERSIPDLKLFFFRIFLDWLSAFWNQSLSSIFDFIDSCKICIWPLYTLCTKVSLFYVNKS